MLSIDFCSTSFRSALVVLRYSTIFLALSISSLGTYALADEDIDVFNLSLEDLLNVKVTAGTLLKTEKRKVPASVTIISADEIQRSGARNLLEALEIFVPNSLFVGHHWEGIHYGMRGVVNDRENKYLLLVDGRVLNNFSHAGVLSERDLVMLRDIKEVQVIRGAGSARYGAGALIGVIDIKTFDGKSFKGTEVTTRVGAVNEFYSSEIKWGGAVGSWNAFLYGGVSKLLGASNEDAPYLPGRSGTHLDSTQEVTAGEPFKYSESRWGEMIGSRLPIKLHASLSNDNTSMWLRYTKGGDVLDADDGGAATTPDGWFFLPYVKQENPTFSLVSPYVGYQQGTASLVHTINHSKDLSTELSMSYSLFDFERRQFTNSMNDAHRENTYVARVLTTWAPEGGKHELVVGSEYLRGEFGYDSPGSPSGIPGLASEFNSYFEKREIPPGSNIRWGTDTYSLIAEHRWSLIPSVDISSAIRTDKNDYTATMFSPRMAVVWSPSEKHTTKLIVSQSSKPGFAAEMRKYYLETGGKSDSERMRSLEAAWEYSITKAFSVTLTPFYNNFRLIGATQEFGNVVVGDQEMIGTEIELAYRTPQLAFNISHGFSKQLGFDSAVSGQIITAAPYGYGNDAVGWSTHITKMNANYEWNDKLSFTSSLRMFWGFPGSKDFRDYRNAQAVEQGDGRFIDSYTDSNYEPYTSLQARLSLATHYKLSQNLKLSLAGHNLLGAFDKSLNNRLILYSGGVRQEPIWGTVSLTYKF